MGWFDFLRRTSPAGSEKRAAVFPSPVSLTYANYCTIGERRAMLLSVVYRCVDLISNSVAQLPVRVYDVDKKEQDNALSYVLNVEPNAVTDRYTLIKLIVSTMLLRGNAYLLIERDGAGEVAALHWAAPDNVTIETYSGVMGETSAVYYVIGGIAHEAGDVVHIRNYSYDGITGVSTITHAYNSINIASDSEASAAGFFKGGCNLGGILNVRSMLSEEQAKTLKASWQEAFTNKPNGTPKGVAVLSGDMEYKPVTVSPADAQLLESRQFNVVDICRFFGVSPTKAYDLTKSSYSTIEAEATAFLTDTLQPILSRIESELRRKLLTSAERHKLTIAFDTSALLRTDKGSLAAYFSTLFNIGVLSQNEIRNTLDLPPIEGGDKHFVQVNMADASATNVNNNGN